MVKTESNKTWFPSVWPLYKNWCVRKWNLLIERLVFLVCYVFCAVLRNFFPHRSTSMFYPLKIPCTNTSLVFISLRVHLQWNISIWLVCYLIRQANGSYQTRLYICNTLHSRQFCYHDFYVSIVSNAFSKVPNPDNLLSLLLALLVVLERKTG